MEKELKKYIPKYKHNYIFDGIGGTPLEKLCQELGWQGGTIWQVLEALKNKER